MFKLEFDASNKPLAAAIGAALVSYGATTTTTTTEHASATPSAAGTVCLTSWTMDCSPAPFPEPAEAVAVVDTAPTPTPDGRVDQNGVLFEPAFCANAEQPFYATGKQAGQWKKRKGVDDEAYNSWYDGARPAAPAGPTTPVTTAAAFGNTLEEVAAMPTNCGEFMAWVSERQAAGLITQADVNAAYTTCGIAMTDLFPPTAPARVADHVESLYRVLSA
jgi:hypothetical protein